MSVYGVPRYALETHAPSCVHIYMHTRVSECVSRSKRPNVEERNSKWTVGSEFGTFMVWQHSFPSFLSPSFSLALSLSHSLSLSFYVASRIERGLRMPRATGGGKTPSFAFSLHPLSSLLHRHRAPTSLPLPFRPHPRSRSVSLLLRGSQHRVTSSTQSDPSSFMNT